MAPLPPLFAPPSPLLRPPPLATAVRPHTPRACAASGPYPAGVGALRNEGAYAVMAAASALSARTGRDVVHLEIGQPGFATPAAVCAAAADAVSAGRTKYVAPGGVGALRAAIAARTARRAGVAVEPGEVVVGPGAKPGLFLGVLALVRAGDEVVIPDPGFPSYEAAVGVAGGTAVRVGLGEGMGFFDREALRRSVGERTRLVVVNSPSNPTGGVATMGDLEYLAGLAKEFDFYVMSDEIYAELTYGAEHAPSILSVPGMKERTIVVDGFSKTWSMTGWRLGWSVMPRHLAERVELLLVHSVGCTAAFVQDAGLAALALPPDYVRGVRDEYRRRRDYLAAALDALPGVRCPAPDGAFYVFADISALGMPCADVARALLEDGFVAVLPGTDFGAAGEGYIRLSYVSEFEVLQEGVRRITDVLGRLAAEKGLAVETEPAAQ